MSNTNPLAPPVSPLAEADPKSLDTLAADRLDEIFNVDPKEKDAEGRFVLTDAKLKVMIDYYRRERLRFLSESLAKEAAGPKPRAKAKVNLGATSVADAVNANEDLI